MGELRPYRGRLAPSPTGLLHLGHASTFWTAFARSQAAQGRLILRMEDLDPQRSRAEFAAAAMEDLRWLGIDWQEGPDVGGAYGPYRQSERQSFYLTALQGLIEEGHVYPCRCSRRDLLQMAHAPHQEELIYPGICRPALGMQWPQTKPDFGKQSRKAIPLGTHWRFRVPDGEAVEFRDGCFGIQRFIAGRDFGDFLVWRRDGVPAYQLAVTVDDAEMRITEVVRGADLLKSTARQILLCRALRLPEPGWQHAPLVTDAFGQRLAKRQDALSLRTLRASGMKPEAVLRLAGRSESRGETSTEVPTYESGELAEKRRRW